MPKYKYRIITHSGNEEKKTIIYDSKEGLESYLKGQGVVISIKETKPFLEYQSSFNNEIIEFFKGIYNLLEAGISIASVMETLAKDEKNRQFKKIIDDISKGISEGNSFYECVKRYNKIFNKKVIEMVKIYDNTADINVLKYIVEDLESWKYLKTKVRTAMSYPIFITLVLIAEMYFFLTKIIPTFSEMYKDYGAKLPAITSFTIKASNVFTAHGKEIIITTLIIVLILKQIKNKIPSISLLTDGILNRMPLIGKLVEQYNMLNISTTLYICNKAGLDISTTLYLMLNGTNNRIYKNGVQLMYNAVIQGNEMSSAITDYKHFSNKFKLYINIGEKSANIERTAESLKNYYAAELDSNIKKATQLIEPLMTILIGAVVGVMVISMYLPMADLSSVLRQ